MLYRQLLSRAEARYPLSDQLRREFSNISGSKTELERSADQMEEEAADIQNNDPRVEEKYREQQYEIGQLNQKIEAAASVMSGLQASIDGVLHLWLPQLRRLTGVINETFSKSFAEFG